MAAMLLAGTAVTTTPNTAACAEAQAAFPFPVIPRAAEPARSHRAAYACAIAGAGLIAASFPLSDRADRLYDDYLTESDPGRIDSRWNSTVTADRVASGSLLAGEALLATAVYLRFIHRPRESRVALVVTPVQCAVSLRF
jgi:hypothetical protein